MKQAVCAIVVKTYPVFAWLVSGVILLAVVIIRRFMDIIDMSMATIIAYAIIFGIQAVAVRRGVAAVKPLILAIGLVAVCLHGVLLHEWIDILSGQNINFFNMLSLASWLVTLLVLVMITVKSVEVLLLIVMPFDILSILLVLLFPRLYVINTAGHPVTLFHILLAVLTFCVLCVAALLAILLATQERLLRYNKAGWLIQKMPALDSMETLLFQVVSFGFILLSVLLFTSIYFYHDIMFHYIVLAQKSVLVIAAWIVFALLLLGRYLWGWRGKKAIYYTLSGVLLLYVAYFGSKLVLEVLR